MSTAEPFLKELKLIENDSREERSMAFKGAAWAFLVLLISGIVICIFGGLFYCFYRNRKAKLLEKNSIAPKPLDHSPEHAKKVMSEVSLSAVHPHPMNRPGSRNETAGARTIARPMSGNKTGGRNGRPMSGNKTGGRKKNA